MFQAKETRHEQNRALLSSIETRGPNAFPAFIDALRHTNQDHLADLLDTSGSYQPAPFTSDSHTRMLSVFLHLCL